MKRKFFYLIVFAALLLIPIGNRMIAHASTARDSVDQLQRADASQTILQGQIDDYHVKANVEGAFDENVQLKIKTVSPDLKVIKTVVRNQNTKILKGLDLSFVNSSGKELEPSKTVSITITSNHSLPDLKVVHVKDQGQAELLKDQQTTKTVSFSSASFSTFYLVQDTDDYTTLFAQLEQGNDVTLQKDLTIPENASYHFLKSSTLDLNGHTLTINNTSSSFVTKKDCNFTIKNGTITGSATGKIIEANERSTVTLDGVTITGISRLCEANKASLTIQNSTIQNCNNTDHATLIVHAGSLTVKESTFNNNTCGSAQGGVLYVDQGSTVTLTKNTFTNNHGGLKGSDGKYTGGRGGALYMNHATVTMSGNTFTSNNSSDYGGAIAFVGSTTATLSNNTFESNTAGCGGALYADNSTLTIHSGTFTSNQATKSDWLTGGGAIYTDGKDTTTVTFDPSDNNDLSFTSNYTNGSGGAVLINGTGMINGGTFKYNTAKGHEGGALTIGYGKATVKKGLFHHNKTGYDQDGNAYNNYSDWGGGAIFCSDKATMNFPTSVVDTGNLAHGFGGGLAGCSTARLYTFGDTNSGIAVYGNAAKQEHVSGSGSAKNDDHAYGIDSKVFMDNKSNDIACFLAGSISNTMYGGTKANYHGSVDGASYSANENDEYIQCSSVLGLTADETAANNVPKSADVIIENNESYTHGGGILNNGIMIFGQKTEITQGTSIVVKADKSFKGQDGNALDINKGDYTFSIKNAKGNVVSTGTTQSADQTEAEITFDRKLVFYPSDFTGDGPYTFTYTLSEDDVKDSSITKDNSTYQIIVKLKKVSKTETVGDQSITRVNYYVENSDDAITVTKEEKSVSSSWSYPYTGHNDDDAHSPTLTIGKDAAFVNIKKQPSLTVKKNVTGELGDKTKDFKFEITLNDQEKKPVSGTYGGVEFKDGKAIITLKNGESKKIEYLPYNTNYVIKEIQDTADQGYNVTYDKGQEGTLTEDKTVTVTNDKGIPADTGYRVQKQGYILLIGVAPLVTMLITLIIRRIRHGS